MKPTFPRRSFPVIVSFALLVVGGLPVFSQQSSRASNPVVILTAFASPPGDTVADTLATTMTSSIELMLNLTGRVTLRRADFLSPMTSLERTIPYYIVHNAAEAVYGSVAPNANGEYAIDLEVWNASDPNGKPMVVKRTISNVLSSFNLADEMSLRVASTIVGRKLEEGTLVVENASGLTKFSVYANGHLLGRNRTSFRILTGSWTIVVAKPGEVGDIPVQSFNIDIQKGETARVALSKGSPPDAAVVNKAGAPQPANSPSPKSSSANGPTPVLTLRPATGSISITTLTPGTLYLDGRLMGHIPVGGATLSSVGVGVRNLTMRYADGHVSRKEVTVRVGSATTETFSYRRVIPGSRWTEHAMPSGQDWQSVAYGHGTFVAVARGPSNVVATSSDGVNWTQSILPSDQAWQSVTHGNGIFVAVAKGPSNVAATSSDGVNWFQSALPSRQEWQSVVYGNGVFVAVGNGLLGNDVVATSNDGINWTEAPLPGGRDLSSVTYGNGLFVVVSVGSDIAATSHNGVDWSEHSMPSALDWQSVAYGNGTFVAVSIGSKVVATSNDGVDWTRSTMPSSQAWQSVAYGNGTFVAVVWNSSVMASSP